MATAPIHPQDPAAARQRPDRWPGLAYLSVTAGCRHDPPKVRKSTRVVHAFTWMSSDLPALVWNPPPVRS